jgi:hypothetical protein
VHCINIPKNTHFNLSLEEKQPLGGINIEDNAIKFIASSMILGVLAISITGCSTRRERPAAPAPAPVVTAPAPAPAPPPVAAAPAAPRLAAVASWAEYRRRAAQMIIAANPGASFTGPQPPQWYGIATVTLQFNADGSLRNLDLMRGSSISPEVNAMALEAARRVGNFGPVSNLPQPWQFNETFLYNSNRLFQLDTIVANR